MKPGDLTKIRTLSSPTVHPDGRDVVFVVSRPDVEDNRYRTSLWRLDLSTDDARPTRLTSSTRDSAPAYSPDGTQLAVLADEATGACYRLRDGRVVEQLRGLGDTRMHQEVTHWRASEDGRDLPTDEVVTISEPSSGRVLRTERRRTHWTDRAPHLPLQRVVDVTDAGGDRHWRIRLLRPAILLPDGPQEPDRASGARPRGRGGRPGDATDG